MLSRPKSLSEWEILLSECHCPDGISGDKLSYVMDLKGVRRGRISEYVKEYPNAEFHEGKRPWSIACDVALPCATQNEISTEEAKTLVKNGCKAVSEGANMPTEQGGVEAFQETGLLYAPSKAANAGGVAVSGLEMSQNSGRISWTEDDLQLQLKTTMGGIHDKCVEYGQTKGGKVDYLKGANIAGFIKVADAMMAYGVT